MDPNPRPNVFRMFKENYRKISWNYCCQLLCFLCQKCRIRIMPKVFGSDRNHVDRSEKLVRRIGQARFQASFSITANFACCTVLISVADPWHYASDSWIRIRILLFSSLTFKTPTKKVFLLITFWRHITVNKKSSRSHKKYESRFFLLFLLDDRRILIRTSD